MVSAFNCKSINSFPIYPCAGYISCLESWTLFEELPAVVQGGGDSGGVGRLHVRLPLLHRCRSGRLVRHHQPHRWVISFIGESSVSLLSHAHLSHLWVVSLIGDSFVSLVSHLPHWWVICFIDDSSVLFVSHPSHMWFIRLVVSFRRVDWWVISLVGKSLDSLVSWQSHWWVFSLTADVF